MGIQVEGAAGAVRTTAAAALVSSTAEVTAFLDQRLPAARAENNNFTLFKALGRATRDGIGGTLSGGDAAVETFLKGGSRPPWGPHVSPCGKKAAP
ncbi:MULTISPECIES: hypothetical protein [unclassified Streptomyces]|uniref:hypothetical protein n=1 Tax=unclassified Streptomyces TaxID=2593676 RepID=UPI00093370FA|nr:hypothetical protein [Streptomyces sp. NBRC 110465]